MVYWKKDATCRYREQATKLQRAIHKIENNVKVAKFKNPLVF